MELVSAASAHTRKNQSALLRVSDLRVEVASQSGRFSVVNGVTFDLWPGEILGIVGESGSGKTMTVLSVLNLLPSAARIVHGSIRFNGEELVTASASRLAEIRGRHVAMVFQDPMTSFNPIMRVGPQVMEPLVLHRMVSKRKARVLATDALRSVGIADPRRNMARYPHEFSGGMRQRAMIASTLPPSPELIIADEPTTALDVTVQAQVLNIIKRLNREAGTAVILISHDLGVVAETCDVIGVMYAGRLVEVGPTQQILARAQHPYTRALIRAMPQPSDQRHARLAAIAGEPPELAHPPSGCPFHPRCPYAVQRCREQTPGLVRIEGTSAACWVAQAEPFPPPSLAASVRPTQVSSLGRKSAPSAPLIHLEHIRKFFRVPQSIPVRPPSFVHAVDDVSLDVFPGETLGIVGETGCGKSTLALSMLRLLDIDDGRIVFKGQDITALHGEPLRRLRQSMQPIFQDPYASLNPRARVRDIIGEPLVAHGRDRRSVSRRVTEVLELVGLDRASADRFPHEFSGGQRQRIGIARAIALGPELIVADEPISALDVSIQAQIINLLEDLRDQLSLTLVFISHDLRMVRHIGSTIAVMHLGRIVEYGPAEAVCAHPRHPYTAALLSAVPSVTTERSDPIVLSGDPPSPVEPPSGCRFRTRCYQVREACALHEPQLEDMGDGQLAACFYPLSQAHQR